MIIDKEYIICEIARGFVRISQAKYEKPADDWTLHELFELGFYADAVSAFKTIERLGYYVAAKQRPAMDGVDALTMAIKASYRGYVRVSHREAASKILSNLSELKYKISPEL